VAKIQKLSDKRHGETGKKEEAVDEAVEITSIEETDPNSDDKKTSEKKNEMGKKHRKENDIDEHRFARKKSKMSVPTVQVQKRRKKTNAKVSKPRRIKITGM